MKSVLVWNMYLLIFRLHSVCMHLSLLHILQVRAKRANVRDDSCITVRNAYPSPRNGSVLLQNLPRSRHLFDHKQHTHTHIYTHTRIHILCAAPNCWWNISPYYWCDTVAWLCRTGNPPTTYDLYYYSPPVIHPTLVVPVLCSCNLDFLFHTFQTCLQK